jgi:hypothetical protein
MRTAILGVLILLATGAAPAWGQYAPGPMQDANRYSVFETEFREPSRGVPESAEDAEGIVARPPRFWVRAEYLIWWIKSANAPILVTAGDPADPIPGALNSGNTTHLFGGNGLDYFDRKGGRFSGGYWLDDEHTVGFDLSYFFLSGRPINRSIVSPGEPVLANPFINANSGNPDSSLVSYPGIMSGDIFVDMPSFLQGADANVSRNLARGEHFRLDGLAGFRWLNLREGLHITESSLVQLAPQFVGLIPLDGNTISVSDRFDTHNNFYGGQLGLRAEVNHKRWTLSFLGKVALGVSHEVVKVRGRTTIDTQPAFEASGGLYAVSSNSGEFARSTFAVVPEAGLNLSFRVTDHVSVFAGYNFLYWSNVARPGDQVDTSINPNFVPTSLTFGAAGGPARPAPNLRSTDFFAHGVNMGLEIRY